MRISLALAAALMLVSPTKAAAPVDEVVVTGERSLRGIWRMGLPGSAGYPDSQFYGAVGEITGDSAMRQVHVPRFGPPREQLCRIGGEEVLVAHCMSFGRGEGGKVAVQGNSFTLVWGQSARLSLVLHGALQAADSFTANFVLQQERERLTGPDKVNGSKVDLARTVDEAGIGFILQGTLAGLALGDAALLMPGAPDVAPPQDLAGLGRVQATYYVGEAPLMRDPQARPALHVYAVEFANGERLCGIHLAHGKVDGLRCV